MTDTRPRPTVTEAIEQLTGYDELAIEKAFGADIDNLRFTLSLRALVFVRKTHEGLKATDAHKAAMEISIKALGDEFADEEPEFDPEDPVTDQGKEPGQPA